MAISQELQNAIWAVDRLNSFVRSKSYRHSEYGCRKAIYYLKRSALKQVIALGVPANHRLTVSVVVCRDCSGSGRYEDWDGRKHPHCWACNSTGMAKLEFVESELLGGVHWHTPRKEWFSVRAELPEQIAQPTNWQPNQEGKDLTVIEAAQALNIAETFFTQRPPIYSHEYGWSYDFDYALYLGEVDLRLCSLCHCATPKPLRHVCCRNLFTWIDSACDECSKAKPGEESVFDQFPFPQYLAEHEAIQQWYARHRGEHLKFENYKAQRREWARG